MGDSKNPVSSIRFRAGQDDHLGDRSDRSCVRFSTD